MADKDQRPISNRRGTVLSTPQMLVEAVSYSESSLKTRSDGRFWVKHDKDYGEALISKTTILFAEFKEKWRKIGLTMKLEETVTIHKIQVRKTTIEFSATNAALVTGRTNEEKRTWKKKLDAMISKIKAAPEAAIRKFIGKNGKYSDPSEAEKDFLEGEYAAFSRHVDEAYAPLLVAAGADVPITAANAVPAARSASSTGKRSISSAASLSSSAPARKKTNAKKRLPPEAPVKEYNKRVRKADSV